MSNPYAKYKQTAIVTANRGQVLIMLYEAAIKYVKQAMVAIDKADVGGKGQAIGKVHDIVNELSVSLDHKVGGQISADLERLYMYMIEQLVKANAENKKEPLEHVKKLLETLLDGWRVAVQEFSKSDISKSQSE